jgi:hypothetical protein
MNEVGEAFAAALKQMLGENQKLTIEKAARKLGVSRQSFHAYLGGRLPRRNRLNKAMQMWNLNLDLKGHSFGKEAFASGETPKSASGWRQVALWETLDSVKQEDLHVKVKRVGKVFRVSVEIEIPA